MTKRTRYASIWRRESQHDLPSRLWSRTRRLSVSHLPETVGHDKTAAVDRAGVLVTASYGDDHATVARILAGATLASGTTPNATADDVPSLTPSATPSVVAPGSMPAKPRRRPLWRRGKRPHPYSVVAPMTGWSGWTSLGGALSGDPVAFMYNTNQINLSP